MKRKISYSLVALVVFFSACSKDLTNQVDDDEPVVHSAHLTDVGGEYTVYSEGLAAAVIDGRQVYITRFKLIDDNGNVEYAFCADMNAPCYDGARYESVSADNYFKNGEETKIMAALTYIMNKYGWMESVNIHGYRQMIQCILWMIIHDYEVTSVDNVEDEIIMYVINYLYGNIDEITDDYNTGVIMQGVDDATKDGLFVNFGPYRVSENALLADVDFNLSFNLGGDYATFVDDTGMEITQVKPGEPFYVRTPDDVFGDFHFTAAASTTNELRYVSDFRFFTDIRPGNYQPLFQPVISSEAETYFYSCDGNFTATPSETETPPETEKITLTGLCWAYGICGGINSFTVEGITLQSSKNYVMPGFFDMMVKMSPTCTYSATAIYTVIERMVCVDNHKYVKVYDLKVAFYIDGVWKVYGGAITVDNPFGSHMVQQVDLERIF